MEPAASIINRLGGALNVAGVLGLSKSAPGKWLIDRRDGGSGGMIPQRHIEPLIRYARSQRIRLGPADFYPQLKGAGGSGPVAERERRAG
jgi:hypothetical protein